MKTIEIKSGDQTAQFTTKSVTFDGKEFFYGRMTDLLHDENEHVYQFTYDGEVKRLPYDEKYGKILNAIFSQVRDLPARTKAAHQTETHTQPEVQPQDKAPESNAEAENPESISDSADAMEAADIDESEKPDEAADKAAADTADTSEPKTPQAEPAKPLSAADKKAAKREEKQRKREEKLIKKAKKEQEKAEKRAAKKGGQTAGKSEAENAEAPKAEAEADKAEVAETEAEAAPDPQRKAKIRKSLIAFGAVIIIFAVLGVAYYFIFGTSNDPSSGAGTNETQQYNDIDELIEDME